MASNKFLAELADLQAMAAAGDTQGYRAALSRLAAVGRVHPQFATIELSTLTSTVTGDSKTWKTAGGLAFLIDEIRGHMSMITPNSETTAFGAIFGGSTTTLPPSFSDRELIKLANVRVASFKQNAGGDVDIIDTQQGKVVLAEIHPRFGKPIEFPCPKLILPSSDLTLSLEMISTAAAIIGAAGTFYGIHMKGLAILEK